MQHDAKQNKAILARFSPSVDNLYRERGENRTEGRKMGKNGVLFAGGYSGVYRRAYSGRFWAGLLEYLGKVVYLPEI